MRKTNWFEKNKLVCTSSTCTSARNIAVDQNKLNQFKIILNLNYNKYVYNHYSRVHRISSNKRQGRVLTFEKNSVWCVLERGVNWREAPIL